jgi:hypothetical protein
MGYFSPANVAQILEEHFSRRANHENKILALLMFALWHDAYIAGHRNGPLPNRPQLSSTPGYPA